MKAVLTLAAVAEAATGIVLVAYPPIVVRLLFGADITGVGEMIGRFAGIALIGLGVACWRAGSARSSLYGMLTYGILATLYLVCVGIRGEAVGMLLWPAVVAHVILVVLLLCVRFKKGANHVDGMGA
jgi:hypothetical protein